MKEPSDDKLMREIVRNSYLELDDREFDAVVMIKIMRAGKRRRIMGNLLISLLIFAAIDAFIWLAIRVTGLSVTGFVNLAVGGLSEIFTREGHLEQTVMANNLTVCLLLSIGAVAAALAIIELQLNSRKGIER